MERTIGVTLTTPGKEGWVYFMGTHGPESVIEFPYTKIGMSANPRRRLKKIQTGCPWELLIMGQIKTNNMVMLEGIIQDIYHDYRVRGEWFRIPNRHHGWISELSLKLNGVKR